MSKERLDKAGEADALNERERLQREMDERLSTFQMRFCIVMGVEPDPDSRNLDASKVQDFLLQLSVLEPEIAIDFTRATVIFRMSVGYGGATTFDNDERAKSKLDFASLLLCDVDRHLSKFERKVRRRKNHQLLQERRDALEQSVRARWQEITGSELEHQPVDVGLPPIPECLAALQESDPALIKELQTAMLLYSLGTKAKPDITNDAEAGDALLAVFMLQQSQAILARLDDLFRQWERLPVGSIAHKRAKSKFGS